MRWLDGIIDSIDMNVSKLQEMAKVELDPTERLNNSDSKVDLVTQWTVWLFRAKRREKEQYQQTLQVLFCCLISFFFLNEEANLVPEVPQQTHTYTFTAQTPSWKGDLLTSIVGERKGEVGWLWRAPRSPANTLYCCRNLGLYEVATSRGKMQCIPSFSKDLFEDFLWAGSWW